MRIARLYLEGDYQSGQTVALPKEQAHYALNVLRLKNGAQLEAFNGQGIVASASLEVINRRSAALLINEINHVNLESPLHTVLVQAISRGDRMDHSIQKAVELGVSEIQPIFSERCEVKLKGEKLEKRRQQWQSIVINACEQSGRSMVPPVRPIQTFQQWLDTQPGFGLVLDPYANQRLTQLMPPPQSIPIHLLIGPEGGLTDQEVSQAQQQGLNAVQLGPRVLRTETAGPAVLAILQTLWGDLG